MHLEYQHLLPQVKEILDTLLQRAEQPDRKQVARVRLNVRSHPWYFSVKELGLRSRVHEQLLWLAKQGWFSLRWQKYEEGNLLEAIDFIASTTSALDTLYVFCGREPQQKQREHLDQLLRSQQPQAAWFEAFLSWALEQLAVHRSPMPLSISTPENNRDLLHALDALARLRTPTLERTLSVHIFGDSKRLAELRPQLITVLRLHAANGAASLDDWELLRTYHLHRPQVYIPLAGPLALEIPADHFSSSFSAQIDLTALSLGLSLPDELLRTAHIRSCNASGVVTIENQTSFQEMLLQRPASLLIFFSNGFPSSTLLTFLQHVRAVQPALPFFHWGDLDAGGFRILLHLRRHLGSIEALGMDIPTFARYRSTARTLSCEDEEALQELMTERTLFDQAPLLKQLLENHVKLEQEAVEVAHILRQLRSFS